MDIFTIHYWGKWEHYKFFTFGYTECELLVRECKRTGLREYKRVHMCK